MFERIRIANAAFAALTVGSVDSRGFCAQYAKGEGWSPEPLSPAALIGFDPVRMADAALTAGIPFGRKTA